MIVGRDTHSLSSEDVLKATMEPWRKTFLTASSPRFFYLILGGLPLAMAYKAVNTLDSMVGYNNDTYRHFGRAAARLDDLANYLPARIQHC